MANRADLDRELRRVSGYSNVYYQPDVNVRLTYPCIIYQLVNPYVLHASDEVYLYRRHYNITVIHDDPDDTTAEKLVMTFKYCSHSGPRFINDNLYHEPLTIFY